MEYRTLMGSLLVGLAAAGPVSAEAESGEAYWSTPYGEPVLTGDGKCWQTNEWTENTKLPGCGGPEQDADGDGVPDQADRCPGTAGGALVDAAGCEPDGDGDGIADRGDSCPNTGPGTAVDAVGCELDSDGDGIADSQDQCPATAAGATVDTKGCPAMAAKPAVPSETITLTGSAVFATGKDTLSGESVAELDQLAQQLIDYPEIDLIEITGHTDNTGPAAVNWQLSEQRAEAVKQYLVGKGVATHRIQTRGMGPSEPLASNDTADGRAQNRRVEIEIKAQRKAK